MNENYGVINEQGFPVGNNLGFKPITEQEREEITKKFIDKDARIAEIIDHEKNK